MSFKLLANLVDLLDGGRKTTFMTSRRFVSLPTDGDIPGDWLYVVVEAKTGVVYDQQCGGIGCRHGQVEGFLVPLSEPDGRNALDRLFCRPGGWTYTWSDGEVDRLRGIVSAIHYCAYDGTAHESHPLRLDESRIREIDEAWVPVITSDGPGVLVWCNSD